MDKKRKYTIIDAPLSDRATAAFQPPPVRLASSYYLDDSSKFVGVKVETVDTSSYDDCDGEVDPITDSEPVPGPAPVRLTYEDPTWYYCKKDTTIETKNPSGTGQTWVSASFLPCKDGDHGCDTVCDLVSIDGYSTMGGLSTRDTSGAVIGVDCPSDCSQELCYCIQQCISDNDCQSVLYKESNDECTYYNCVDAGYKEKSGDAIFYMATGNSNATLQCSGQNNTSDLSKTGAVLLS